MLTTCPECRTTFRLSHAQLEVRRGLVRCGYCKAVFNAYDTLLPEFETPAEAKPSPPPEQAAVAPAVKEPVPDWDIPAPILPESLREDRKAMPEPGSWQVDAEDEAPEDDAFVLHLSDRVDEETPGHEKTAASPTADRMDDILLTELPTRARIEPERRGGGKWLSGLLGVILALALAAQLVYFLRGPLVSWLPELRPGLEAVCAPLGCQIPQARDIAAIRIESSSLETDPEQANRATLRVSFSNRSQTPQQWPHLVLKLTDWQGGALAQRAFGPADYLAKDQTHRAGMAPMSEHEIRLDLDLGGLSASGYEVLPRYP